MAYILKPVPDRVLLHWTKLAIQCYKSGCNCSQCNVIKNLETVNVYNCAMKASVLKLIKKFGLPKDKKEEICLEE